METKLIQRTPTVLYLMLAIRLADMLKHAHLDRLTTYVVRIKNAMNSKLIANVEFMGSTAPQASTQLKRVTND
jgi:hypothetical protein